MSKGRGCRAELYVCPVCRYRYVVYRRRSQRRPMGHGKTMWCPFCGRSRVFRKVL